MYREPLGRNCVCPLSASRTPFFSHLMVTGGCPWAWQSSTAGSFGSTVTSEGSVMKDNSLKHKTPGEERKLLNNTNSYQTLCPERE